LLGIKKEEFEKKIKLRFNSSNNKNEKNNENNNENNN